MFKYTRRNRPVFTSFWLVWLFKKIINCSRYIVFLAKIFTSLKLLSNFVHKRSRPRFCTEKSVSKISLTFIQAIKGGYYRNHMHPQKKTFSLIPMKLSCCKCSCCDNLINKSANESLKIQMSVRRSESWIQIRQVWLQYLSFPCHCQLFCNAKERPWNEGF